MPAPRRRRTTAKSRQSPYRKAGRIFAGVVAAGVVWLGYVALTVPDVRPLIAAPPDDTAFMRLCADQAHAEGRPAHQDYRRVGRTSPGRKPDQVRRR